jgi:hypothetical protein
MCNPLQEVAVRRPLGAHGSRFEAHGCNGFHFLIVTTH